VASYERDGSDPVLEATNALAVALRANVAAAMAVLDRIDVFRENRAAGVPYSELFEQPVEESSSVVEMLAANQERLAAAGAPFRRALANQMVLEGYSQAHIAKRFGVSRQRIAALLAGEPEDLVPKDVEAKTAS
jgi:transcriptional regulator with XRE-family HTH domain